MFIQNVGIWLQMIFAYKQCSVRKLKSRVIAIQRGTSFQFLIFEFINWSINGLTPKMNFSILNVTSGKATTIGELGEIIKKAMRQFVKSR